jgi:integrase
MITLSNWGTRMSEDMRLRDFRPRTQEGYLLAVRQFMDRVAREPETFTDEDVRGYFLYLREEKKLAPSSINIAVHALRFFFIHTMQRDWKIFDLLRVNKPRVLPVVLSPAEVRAVLGAVRHPARRVALTTIYALGLRLGEGLSLEAGHIDSERLMVWVRDGKGGQGSRHSAVPAFAHAAATLLEARAPCLSHQVPVRGSARHRTHRRNHPAEDVHRCPPRRAHR